MTSEGHAGSLTDAGASARAAAEPVHAGVGERAVAGPRAPDEPSPRGVPLGPRSGWSPGRLLARLDAVPMHKLVIGVLSVIQLAGVIAAFAGVLAYDGAGILAAAAAAAVVSVLAADLLGRAVRRPAHLPSSIITGQIIALIAWPSLQPADLVTIAVVAVLAAVAKALIVVRGRPVVNPAAFGMVVAAVLLPLFGVAAVTEAWWVASVPLFPLVAIGGALVLVRTRLVLPGLALVIGAVALLSLATIAAGVSPSAAMWAAVAQSPAIFLAAFMYSEPITLAPLRWQRIAIGALVGVLVAVPVLVSTLGGTVTIGAFTFGQAAALLIGNLLAFALGPRRGARLTLTGIARVGDVAELRFEATPPLKHRAGQWVELSLPHRSDAGGERRVFSVASAPGEQEVVLGIRAQAPLSSFKRELLAMEPGGTVRVTRQGGDFTPRGQTPRLMIAAGIGVTPFLAHLRADGGAQTVVVLLSRPGEPVAFADVLDVADRVILVTADTPTAVPQRWERLTGLLDAERLADVVPDLKEREVLVSGATDQVRSLRAMAHTAGARRVRIDEFSGY